MNVALLAAHELHVRYGAVEALGGVSIEVRAGDIVTVIGPNGAGKSTLLNALMGLLPLAAGQLRWCGAAPAQTVEGRVGAGLSLVPERRELFASMSVLDNLLLGGYVRAKAGRRDSAAALEEVLVRFPRLAERRHQLAGTLSGGERQMLAIGRALMARPTLLMLDEPSLGLAPLVVREVFHLIAELRRAGVAILLVEQNARAALAVADQAYVIENGQVVLQGPAAEIAKHPGVAASYLGL